MCQEDSTTTDSQLVRVLWKILLGVNAAFIAGALISAVAFRSRAGLELLLWFLVCEVFLFLALFVPVFLYYWVWRRQKPTTAAAHSLDALVTGITHLAP